MPGADDLIALTSFVLIVAVTSTVLTTLLALAYLRNVRLERPAIGVFNRRDIVVLFCFIVGLPLLYLALPLTPLIVALGITFASALSIGLRPLLGPTLTWIAVGLLIGINIWMTRTILGTVLGWQLFWLENSIIVVIAAVSVSNLYVQGGMSLRHVAWFAVILAVYDATFQFIWPVTTMLAQRFLGWPLDPAVGFRWEVNNASIGLGDLLVYSVFVIAVYKGYGPIRARVALVLAVVFGAVIPALIPLVFDVFTDARTDLFVPAQVAFGPIAFWYYRRLRRTRGRERTMAEFLASPDVARRPDQGSGRHHDIGTPAHLPPTRSRTKAQPTQAPASPVVVDPSGTNGSQGSRVADATTPAVALGRVVDRR